MEVKGKIATLGALMSAALASICCIGPLVLVGLGLGGLGLAASLVKYRPFFLGLTAIFLGVAFYLIYRKREVACADGRCELRSGSKTMKATLWVITVFAAGLATFPTWSALLVNRPSATASANAETVTLSISGMTCSACVVAIERSLKNAPGVQAASVNLEKAEAIVLVEPGEVPTEHLLKAVQAAGRYTAEIKKGS